MSSQTNKFKGIFLTFLMLVIGLALTPSVASFATDALYQETTQTIAYGSPLDPGTSNVTVPTYDSRINGTAVAVLYQVSDNTTVTTPSDYNVTVTAVDAITWTGLDNGEDYWGTITYETDELTSTAVTALVPLSSLLYVVVVLAVGIAAIYLQIGKIR